MVVGRGGTGQGRAGQGGAGRTSSAHKVSRVLAWQKQQQDQQQQSHNIVHCDHVSVYEIAVA